MAIVDMTRFSLFTFARDQEELLKKLQEFNYVHLLKPEIKDPETEGIADGPKTEQFSAEVIKVNEQVEMVNQAIKLLSNYDTRPGGLKGLRENIVTIPFAELEEKVRESNWEDTYEKVREITSRLDQLTHEETKLRTDLEEVSNWDRLDISPAELKELKVAKAILGSIPRKISNDFEAKIRKLELTTAKQVGGTKQDAWYLIITHPLEEEELSELLKQSAFSQLNPDYDELPVERKKRLNQAIIDIKVRQGEVKEELKAHGGELPKLELAFEYLENKKLRLMADDQFIHSEFTKGTQGFIPTERMDEFVKTIEAATGDTYYLTTEAAHREDPDVPILLKNGKFAGAFTDVTTMFAYPTYNDVDPTPLLAPFYMVFFGMMMGDVGYGLLLLLGSAYALKKLNLKKSMRRMVTFFHYLSYPTIVWGLIYGSFLSLEIGLPSLLTPADDYMTILIISIILGGVQLFFGLGIKGYVLWKNGERISVILDVVSWYMALTGLILFLLAGMLNFPPVVGEIGKWVMIIGMALIVVFAARDSKSWPGRIAGGVYELYGISSWVGDFVSYSRLMALGLSGGFIAMAFNMMAEMVSGAWYLIPFGLLIFLFGHAFNLFLSVLSAYVHALRLTYVEFFGKFFDGGGKPLKRMKKEPKYMNFSDPDIYG